MSGSALTNTLPECGSMFPSTVEEVNKLAKEVQAKADADLEAIYAIPEADATFASVVKAADNSQADFSAAQSIIGVVKMTNVSKEVRDAATEKEVELDAFAIDKFSNNKKLFGAFQAVDKKDSEKATLSTQAAYCFGEAMDEFRRKGLELPEEKFESSVKLQKKISELSTAFMTNLSEDKSQVLAGEEEVVGVPEGILKGLDKDEASGKYILKMDYPTFFGVMQNCEVAATRKTMADAFDARAHPVNGPVLNEIISTRHDLATLLGFESYSAYDLSSKMAKKPATAQSFIDGLVPGLQEKWKVEKQKLIDAGLDKSVVLTPEGDFQYYDVAFVMNQYKKKFLNVDEEKISEYFPMESTVEALFTIYQKFFDVTFDKSTEDLFWEKSCLSLTVTDNKTKSVLGHVVLDLFPREGKYTHACCAGIVPPVRNTDGTDGYKPALAVVLANFPKPGADGKPALFKHSDAETFFHEFGHAIHNLCGRSELASFGGTNTKTDFVELPSQMLEEWLWEKDILKMVTQHYETKEKLPDELIESKVASKNAFVGRDSLRQLQFATLSLTIFDTKFAGQGLDKLNPQALVQETMPRIMNGVSYNPNPLFHCNFGHLTGYGATYYGYMYSEVFAADVFEYIRSRDGLLNPEFGRRYVDCIIGCGGARDPNDMLKDFLGREANSEAFLKRIGM